MSKRIPSSIEELIGNTPLVELKKIESEFSLSCRLLAKLEYLNPAGSSKDRIGLSLINDAEQRGLLKDGSVIIEPTSGNTGIGLAAVAASRGYHLIIVMPDSMSEERKRLMRAYGADLVLTDGALGMSGAIAKAEELASSIPGAFVPGQFVNPANPEAHYRTTGPEIWTDTEGDVSCFVAGIGTGGTITGTGRFLKEKDPSIWIAGVEPAGSPVLSGGKPGAHDLQGIGAGFVPDALDTSVYNEIITIENEEAYRMGRLLARKEGYLCGITSGAALAAAVKIGSRPEFSNKTVVALLPDTGDRYLSTKLFEE
ncbi:MAG: cysteine synthase A [Oscillospiraceae bacterium]|nr:cysteine synthase A [Oscillospiraceae bacterium]